MTGSSSSVRARCCRGFGRGSRAAQVEGRPISDTGHGPGSRRGRREAPSRAGRAGRRRGQVRRRHPRRYAQDASNYRQVPIGVVVPRTVDAAAAAVAVCREHEVPVLSRGGGTSLAGQCCNEAVVIDWTKYCHRLVSVDRRGEDRDRGAGRRARQGQRRAGPARADGRAQAVYPRELHDRRHDRQQLVRVDRPGLRQDGRLGPPAGDPLLRRAADLGRGDQRRGVRADPRGRRREGGAVPAAARDPRQPTSARSGPATRKIPRRVSGYNLDQLLPEKGFHVARAVVGSESTLVTVLHGRAGPGRDPAAAARWSCSAIPTSPRPPTPCRLVAATIRWRSRGSTTR